MGLDYRPKTNGAQQQPIRVTILTDKKAGGLEVEIIAFQPSLEGTVIGKATIWVNGGNVDFARAMREQIGNALGQIFGGVVVAT